MHTQCFTSLSLSPSIALSLSTHLASGVMYLTRPMLSLNLSARCFHFHSSSSSSLLPPQAHHRYKSVFLLSACSLVHSLTLSPTFPVPPFLRRRRTLLRSARLPLLPPLLLSHTPSRSSSGIHYKEWGTQHSIFFIYPSCDLSPLSLLFLVSLHHFIIQLNPPLSMLTSFCSPPPQHPPVLFPPHALALLS